jgi:L-rhamnose mutarotase
MLAKNNLPVIQEWRRQTGECFDMVTEQELCLAAKEVFHHDF